MAISVLPHRDELAVKEGQLYIDGSWVDGSAHEQWTHVHPATNEEVTRLAIASTEDVDRAVRAARRAFDEGPWPGMKARERKRILDRVVALVREHSDELTRLQTLENGIPLTFSSIYQISGDITADIFDYHAGWIDKFTGQTFPEYTGPDSFTFSLREPVGVVAGVLPWNAPLMLFAQKVAPALAAGCTMVVKPSEYAPLTSLRLTQLLEEAGVPPGVFNLVVGPGDTTGEALITHPMVDKITFTGSRRVGGRVLEAAGADIKRVALELGGKSPKIIFPDAPDIGLAAMTAFGGVAMGMSGQGCVIMTRTLVHESIYDQVIDTAASLAGMVRYGDPFDPDTTSAPLINQRQLERVTALIEKGIEQGARLVVGGDRPADADLANGNFVNPTLFADCDNKMTIAQEEIFGPVLAVIPFKDEDEAIRLANDTTYGLGATIWTTDVRRALRFSKLARAGTFGVNTQTLMPNFPFGGYKASGLGREGGAEGFEAFTEVKTVTVAL